MHELIVRSGIVLTGTLRHFSEGILCPAMGAVAPRPAPLQLQLCEPNTCDGRAFLSTQTPDPVSPGEPALSLWLRWGLLGVLCSRWGLGAAGAWVRMLVPCSPSAATRQQGPLAQLCCCLSPCWKLHRAFFFCCWKKQGWMGSDSFVRKVWKLVTVSTSGVVWRDEQGTGYKAAVISLLYVMPHVLVKLGLKICGKGCLSDTAG